MLLVTMIMTSDSVLGLKARLLRELGILVPLPRMVLALVGCLLRTFLLGRLVI